MKKGILLVMVIVFAMIMPNEVNAFSGGLLDGLNGRVSLGDVSYSTAATDDDLSTRVRLRYSNGYIEYTLPGIYNVTSIAWNYQGSEVGAGLRIIAYGPNNQQIAYYGTSGQTGTATVNWKNVKYIRAQNTNSAFSLYLREINAWGMDASRPAIPTGLTATSDIEKVHLDWNDNTEDFLAGYNVYQNGEKINNELIKVSEYTVEPLSPSDQYYSFQVTAVGNTGLESEKSATVKAFSMHKPIIPELSYVNLTHNSLRLNWTDAKGTYQVYKDGEKYGSKTTYRFMDVTGLQPDTEYTFTVEVTDRYNRVFVSEPLIVRTELADKPVKPLIKVSDVTHEGFKASWNTDAYTVKFKIFLDGIEVAETEDTSYEFSGLEPDKVYTLKIVSFGNTGKTEESIVTTRTKKQLGAEIIRAGYSGTPDQRKLTYVPNEYVNTVKVYVNGQLIGEYPASQTEIELDLSEITEKFVDVVLEPTGPNPVTYNMKMPVESFGNEGLDKSLSGFLDGFPVVKKSFLYIALFSTTLLLIIVVVFFWIRKKLKLIIRDKNQDKPFSDVKPNNFRQLRKLARKYSVDATPDERRVYQPRRKKGPSESRNVSSSFRNELSAFKIVESRKKVVPVGMFGFKTVKDVTYERNGVLYKRNYVKGKGYVYVPKDFRNKMLHVSNQVNAVKAALTGSNKNYQRRK
jgi:Fibronectin type 3 domain-containing protein